MIQVAVFYPQQEGGTFDEKYYLEKHIPLVKDRLTPRGLVRTAEYKGVSAADPSQPPQYAYVGFLYFNTVEEVHEAFKAEGRQVMGDTPNYTNIKPIIQINESLG